MSVVGGARPALATGAQALERLKDQPGGPELLELAACRDDLMLVGGAVRDLLIGRQPRELDVVVADGAMELAAALASRLGTLAGENPEERSELAFHERFRTALVHWSEGQIDVATRRSESYPEPGALPQVGDGTIEQDLHRRDFTVNAIAIELGGPRRGALQAAGPALEDLAGGQLRVLHDQSFIDDPTRLLRLARYQARLGFEIEPHTAQLAQQAIAGRALQTVSRARIGGELRLALGEAAALAALEALQELGVLGAINEALRVEVALAERALALLPADGHRGALVMASLLLARAGAALDEAQMFALLNALEFTAGERECIIRSALLAGPLLAKLQSAARPSQLHAALSREPLEAVALAGALAGPNSSAEQAARSWLDALRKVELSIGGEDLLAAGIPAGPEIGRLLAATRAAKLDGELQDGRDGELAFALGEHV